MDLKKLTETIAADNAARGWHDRWRSLESDQDHEGMIDHAVAKLALIDTEVAEAIEEIRNGNQALYYVINGRRVYRVTDASGADWTTSPNGRADVEDEVTFTGIEAKPEGVGPELADVLIRTLDTANLFGIDLPSMVEQKLHYNRTRGHKHGGKAI